MDDPPDIVAVVARRVTLRPLGENFVGLCPFHAEKTPSFLVDTSERTYCCLGCDASGDVTRFLELTTAIEGGAP